MSPAPSSTSSSDVDPLVWESFFWGLLSASSLNIGSLIGVTCLPKQKVNAILMAFGGGALLFALSVELFGHVLHTADVNDSNTAVWIMEGSAICGGFLFACLNRALNQTSAGIRKHATAKGRFDRLRKLLLRRLASRLWKVQFFSALTLEELKDLIQHAMYKARYKAGDVIINDVHKTGIYFIISGMVRLQIVDDPKAGADDQLYTWDLGPNQIFGDMVVLSGSFINTVVEALVPTKVLVLPHHEVARLLDTSESMRHSVSLSAVSRLQQCSELHNLPDHALASLSARCTHSQFQVGDEIFSGTVGEDTPLICAVLGSIELHFHETGERTVLHASCLLCTEHYKGEPCRPFTATAVEPTSVLVLQRRDLDEAITVTKRKSEPLEPSRTTSMPGSLPCSVPSPHVEVKMHKGLEHADTDMEDILSTAPPSPDMHSEVPDTRPAVVESEEPPPAQPATAWEEARAKSPNHLRLLAAPLAAPPPLAPAPAAPSGSPGAGTSPVGLSDGHGRQDQLSPPEVAHPAPNALGTGSVGLSSRLGRGKQCSPPKPLDLDLDTVTNNERIMTLGQDLGWDDHGRRSPRGKDSGRAATVAKLTYRAFRMDQTMVTDLDLVEQEEVLLERDRYTNNSSTPSGGGLTATSAIVSASQALGMWARGQVMAEESKNQSTIFEDVPTVATDAFQHGQKEWNRRPPRSKQTGVNSMILTEEPTLSKPAPPEGGHGHAKAGGAGAQHAALMVWLGILIDAVPESLVVGILVNKSAIQSGSSSASVALPFVISVFLSNLPEAMSSSGSMKAHGVRKSTILLMWVMTTVVTGIGALLGAVLFPPETIADESTERIVSAVEGLAAGAMLTMIAQTMMPEAFEQGGDVVGLACLLGFLSAMSVKLIPV